jgi:hypothetical protein
MNKSQKSAIPDAKDKALEFAEVLLTGIVVGQLTAFLFSIFARLFLPRTGILVFLSYPTTFMSILGSMVGGNIYRKRETPKRSRGFYMAIVSLIAALITAGIVFLMVFYFIRYFYPVNI